MVRIRKRLKQLRKFITEFGNKFQHPATAPADTEKDRMCGLFLYTFF